MCTQSLSFPPNNILFVFFLFPQGFLDSFLPQATPDQIIFQPLFSFPLLFSSSSPLWINSILSAVDMCSVTCSLCSSSNRRHVTISRNKAKGMKNESAVGEYFPKPPSLFFFPLLLFGSHLSSSHTFSALNGATYSLIHHRFPSLTRLFRDFRSLPFSNCNALFRWVTNGFLDN